MTEEEKTPLNSLTELDFLPDWDHTNTYQKKEKHHQDRKKVVHKKSKYTKKEKNEFVFQVSISQIVNESVKKQLRSDAITRDVSVIAAEILKRQAFALKVQFKERDKNFIINKKNGEIYLNEEDAITELIKDSKFVEIKKGEKIQLKGNFQYIYKCNKTGNFYPPTSHDAFDNLIETTLMKSKVNFRKKDYIASLSKSTDAEEIKVLQETDLHKTTFSIDETNQFFSMDALVKYLKEVNFQKFFTRSNTIKLTAKSINDISKYSIIKKNFSLISKERIKNDISKVLLIALKRANFHTFISKKVIYISAYKPKKYIEEEMNQCCKLITQRCGKQGAPIKELLGEYENFKKKKIEILQEIKWLLKEGILRQYSDGNVELT